MMRTMFDGIDSDAAQIPRDAAMVAGYVDGLYKWSDAEWNLFPNAVKVRIAVFATTNDGHVLDCEPGNCTPAQAVDWVLLRRQSGADPTVYCNQLNPTTGWPAVREAFRARGVPEPHYWVANYDGNQQIPAGAIGKQYADQGSYDLSVMADYWPGVDLEVDVPLTVADADLILHRVIDRAGAGLTGHTTLADMVAWNDSHVQGIVDTIKASVAPAVDPVAVANSLAANPAFVNAIAAAVKNAQPKSFSGTLS